MIAFDWETCGKRVASPRTAEAVPLVVRRGHILDEEA